MCADKLRVHPDLSKKERDKNFAAVKGARLETLPPLREIVSLPESRASCYFSIPCLKVHSLRLQIDMTDNRNPTPALFAHPELGQVRALISFNPDARNFLEHLVDVGDIRCVLHEGYQFVPLRDVEPFSLTDLDGEEIAQMILPPSDQTSSDSR